MEKILIEFEELYDMRSKKTVYTYLLLNIFKLCAHLSMEVQINLVLIKKTFIKFSFLKELINLSN